MTDLLDIIKTKLPPSRILLIAKKKSKSKLALMHLARKILNFLACRGIESQESAMPCNRVPFPPSTSSGRSSASDSTIILPGRASMQRYLRNPQRVFIPSKKHEGYRPVEPIFSEENSFYRTPSLESLQF
jgi:hypothetical protein